MLLYFWRTATEAARTRLRILSAVADLLNDSIPELNQGAWADRIAPAQETPRCRISSLGRRSGARTPSAKLEIELFQVSLYDDDEERIDIIADKIDATLDGGRLRLAAGERDQRFFQMKYVSGPLSMIEGDRETAAQQLFGRIWTYEATVDVAIAARQRS